MSKPKARVLPTISTAPTQNGHPVLLDYHGIRVIVVPPPDPLPAATLILLSINPDGQPHVSRVDNV